MAETKDKRQWLWEVRLQLMSHVAADPILLSEFGNAIRRSIERIETEGGEENTQDGWDITDSECEKVEAMLGMSFIACQLNVTGVVSRCRLLHESGELGNKPSKRELMQRCSQIIGSTPYTQITAIDAFANYFKHEDEWPPDWSRCDHDTAGIVKAMGARPGRSGNMRTGFEKILSHNQYERVMEFDSVVTAWAKKLRNEYEQKLKDLNLLSSA